jgi:hypothetical protein
MCSGANRWNAANRSALKNFFCMSRAPGGGRPEVENPKSKNRKLQNRKNRKSKFFAFAEKDEKAKKPRDRASLFDGYRSRQKRAFRLVDFQYRP